MLSKTLREFLRLESANGILLIIATVLAMVVVNSPAKPLYDMFLDLPVEVRIGQLELAKPLLLWINDGLMAIFFLLIGLEIKREFLEGELSEPSRIVLPAIGAIGGMVIPALVYVLINFRDPIALSGWAIPAATDIAFALGILALLSPRIPASLKLFLLTLAIIDDLGAIIIIALFYSGDLSWISLLVAVGALLVLFWLNRRGVMEIAPYILLGIVLWVAVLKSGVHATLAGVLLAFFIPLRSQNESIESPLHKLEHDLHPSVVYGILPLFAFANTGISFQGLSLASLLNPIPLGIAIGLYFGKQIGVFGFVWLAIKLRLANLPDGANWLGLFGVATLCGVGFTMGLFVSSLAFEQVGTGLAIDNRLGILLGSLLAGVTGYLVLRYA
ncbi:MAG TPA: Na+/H+ antiporter NhaA, partial [Chloroflexi bacterium]|nr:Na+/H+ antiporter NhaA [Chloroflexota bacterium]